MKSLITSLLASGFCRLAVAFTYAGIIGLTSASAWAGQTATGIDYEQDSANIRTMTFDNVRGGVSVNCSSSRSRAR